MMADEALQGAYRALWLHLRAHGCQHDLTAIAAGDADEALAEQRFTQPINPDPATAMADYIRNLKGEDE